MDQAARNNTARELENMVEDERSNEDISKRIGDIRGQCTEG